MRHLASRPFRIGDAMVLVAATAVAFALYRHGGYHYTAFSTFGGTWEAWIFFWMQRVVPFPSLWSFAVFLISARDARHGRRRARRYCGVVAAHAATLALAVVSLISSGFYLVHLLEDQAAIRKMFSHGTGSHHWSPFLNGPLEEIVGATVLGAWSALVATRRWWCEPSWIDRLGRALGFFWIALLFTYLIAYLG
jgi:hypothetical protein